MAAENFFGCKMTTEKNFEMEREQENVKIFCQFLRACQEKNKIEVKNLFEVLQQNERMLLSVLIFFENDVERIKWILQIFNNIEKTCKVIRNMFNFACVRNNFNVIGYLAINFEHILMHDEEQIRFMFTCLEDYIRFNKIENQEFMLVALRFHDCLFRKTEFSSVKKHLESHIGCKTENWTNEKLQENLREFVRETMASMSMEIHIEYQTFSKKYVMTCGKCMEFKKYFKNDDGFCFIDFIFDPEKPFVFNMRIRFLLNGKLLEEIVEQKKALMQKFPCLELTCLKSIEGKNIVNILYENHLVDHKTYESNFKSAVNEALVMFESCGKMLIESLYK
jgi:hypothetical protein